jgi:subtilisin family serine protease
MNIARRTPLIAMAIALASQSFGADKIGPKLSSTLLHLDQNDQVVAWVFFKDKGSHEQMRSSVPLAVISERSLQRRRKVRASNELVEYADLPVEQNYVEQLSQYVERVRQQSKWFNAASVVATKSQINAIATLPFVDKLELTWRARANRALEQEMPETDSPGEGNQGNGILDLSYGGSLNQNQQINVPAVHNTGNYAQGVILAVFDNGFRLLTHQAFDSLRSRIIATYDWVDHKVSVVPNNTSSSFGAHGVNTLSTAAGYREGQLIGPAFGATIVLARTENDSSETPVEEDNWVAAIEWADSIGVDVVSCSLGYLTYDPPYTSWTWEDMDGRTTVISRAAAAAVRNGIVCVNSAGNEGPNASHNTLIAPADADSVLSAGAVTSSGVITSFSSVGPTTSVPPRIKPDFCAQGSGVRAASATNPTGYSSVSGTSFSCPLSAGVVALIIKARPNATPVQIGDALRSTASRASTPDNTYGWGIINAMAAINALPLTETPEQNTAPTAFKLEQNYPNPFNPTTYINYSLPEDAFVSIRVYDELGREVKTLLSSYQTAPGHRVVWDGKDASGSPVASGLYVYRLSATNARGTVFTDSKKMMLLK